MHRRETESVEKSAVLSQWEVVHCAVAPAFAGFAV